jgi:hypothetical protein
MASPKIFEDTALSLPDVEEAPHFESRSFRVRRKIFAQLSSDGASGVLKLPLLQQAELVADDPATYSVPPHWGQYGWTNVRLVGVEQEHLRELIVASWRTVAPKKSVKTLDRSGE